MENQAMNQLPEAHSLPDGFVESSVEPLAPRTPTSEQEKPPATDYKEETLSELETSTESRHELTAASSDSVVEVQADKLRTFPVPLSEKDGADGSGEKEEVGSSVGRENAEEISVSIISEVSLPVSSYDEPLVGAEGSSLVSEEATGRCLVQQASDLKKKSTPESTELLKNTKLVSNIVLPPF